MSLIKWQKLTAASTRISVPSPEGRGAAISSGIMAVEVIVETRST
jgi:hypothetical protein